MAFPLALAVQLAALVGPQVVRWVAGDTAGGVADKIGAVASAVTGAATPEEALAQLQQDQRLRAEFRSQVLKQEAELEKAYLRDRDRARVRDIALRKISGDNLRGDILAFLAIFSLAGLSWLLVFFPLPAGAGRDLLLLVAGALVRVVSDVYGFEFGSSRDSRVKTGLLAGTWGAPDARD